MSKKMVKLIECPRDAMQGWPTFIQTEKKIEYINALLKVGFDTIDFGSFVSPKAIPQMADTKEVFSQLDIQSTKTKLLAIVANKRGAEEAAALKGIDYVGFPFSISETFQQKNTQSSIANSFNLVSDIQEICVANNKQLVIYISMAFGNPYGDVYNEDIVFDWSKKISALGVNIISLADTVGLASANQVKNITQSLIESFPNKEIGVHLHSAPDNWKEKVEAALEAGCKRFDGALKGIGGCPLSGNDLVGNMDSERMIAFFKELHLIEDLNEEALRNCIEMAGQIFV